MRAVEVVEDAKVPTNRIAVNFNTDDEKHQVTFLAAPATLKSLKAKAKEAFDRSFETLADAVAVQPIFVASHAPNASGAFALRAAFKSRKQQPIIVAVVAESAYKDEAPPLAEDFLVLADDRALTAVDLPFNTGRQMQIIKWLTEALDINVYWNIDEAVEIDSLMHVGIGHVKQPIPPADALLYVQHLFRSTIERAGTDGEMEQLTELLNNTLVSLFVNPNCARYLFRLRPEVDRSWDGTSRVGIEVLDKYNKYYKERLPLPRRPRGCR